MEELHEILRKHNEEKSFLVVEEFFIEWKMYEDL